MISSPYAVQVVTSVAYCALCGARVSLLVSARTQEVTTRRKRLAATVITLAALAGIASPFAVTAASAAPAAAPAAPNTWFHT